MPIRRAAASDRSAMRPDTNGPRSFTTTSTLRWFPRLVTRTRVPNGSVRCAMVSALGSNGSPLAVFLPAKSLPYIEIRPRCCVLIAVSPDDGGGRGWRNSRFRRRRCGLGRTLELRATEQHRASERRDEIRRWPGSRSTCGHRGHLQVEAGTVQRYITNDRLRRGV